MENLGSVGTTMKTGRMDGQVTSLLLTTERTERYIQKMRAFSRTQDRG